MKALHITAHLGGGIGKALTGAIETGRVLDPGVNHEILHLEALEQTVWSDACMQAGAAVHRFEWSVFYQETALADVVIFHWWNHPGMARLLMKMDPILARVIFWIHVSGCSYPFLPFPLVQAADFLFFTTPYTFDHPFWSQEEKKITEEKAAVIYGLGKLPKKRKGRPSEDGRFVVGYIGTIQEAKIHPYYPEFCCEVKRRIPNAEFVVVGKNEIGTGWDERLERLGLKDCFHFAGFSAEIERYLAEFHAFGYLLNPDHYGTTENALLEAMAAGVPVVVMDQKPEQYIVEQEKTGLLVSNLEEYGEAMERLARSASLRNMLGDQAAETVKARYSLKENVKQMYLHLERLTLKPKHRICFKGILGETPWQWFLACAPREKSILERLVSYPDSQGGEALPAILTGRTKGSVYQYAKWFPEEVSFRLLCDAAAISKERSGFV